MTDLNIPLADLREFERRVGLPPCPRTGPDLDYLTALTRALMATIPYTNINVLAGPGRRPDRDDIVEQMLSLQGGPCPVITPFMHAYLEDYIGLECTLIGATMEGTMRHSALLVGTEQGKVLVDYANANPYLTPVLMDLPGKVYRHADLDYTIRPVDGEPGRYQMLHRRTHHTDWQEDYVFSTEPRSYSYFTKIFDRHYSDPSFGRLLNCLRLIRFPDNEMIAIRDTDLLLTHNGKRERKHLDSDQQIIEAVQEYFPQATYPIQQALDYWKKASAEKS